MDKDGLDSVVLNPNDKLTQSRSEQPNGSEDEKLLDEAIPVGVISEDDVMPKPPLNEALNDALTHNRSWQPNGRDEVELLDDGAPTEGDILSPTLADADALNEALTQRRS